MQSDDLECPGLGRSKPLLGARKLAVADSAGLMAPRAHGVQSDHVQRGRGVGRLGGLPLSLELAKRPCEARRERVRNVVIPWNRQNRAIERSEEIGGTGELVLPAPVAEIPARDHELRLEALGQNRCPALDRLVVPCSVMEVGQV